LKVKIAVPTFQVGDRVKIRTFRFGKDYAKGSIHWPSAPWGSLELTADAKFDLFCRFLEPKQPEQGSATTPTAAPMFTTSMRGKDGSNYSMSRSVLEKDGFVLGRLVNSGKDQEAFGQNRYSVYEVISSCRPCSQLFS
jgi:hypothetical protein